MRTNIDIDDGLMRQAMRFGGARIKKATVEAGQRLLVDTHAQGVANQQTFWLDRQPTPNISD